LAVANGQDLLEQLVNARDGSPLSPGKKKQYRGALLSFSRFLRKSWIVEEDLFFSLRRRSQLAIPT
jgi:hypothetical protein